MDRRRFLAGALSASVVLATEPRARAARLGGTPVALVTADLESHVVMLSLSTRRAARRIVTAAGPRSIEAVGDYAAIVAHTQLGGLTVIDTNMGRIRAELDGLEAPRYTAAHPDLTVAYVTDSAREEVVAVDAARGRIVGRVRVPGPARHVSISPDGRTIVTALGSKASRVAVLDASDPHRLRLVRTFAAPFLAHDVAFAPDGRTLWVTSGDQERIALYRGGRVVRLVDAGSPPQHVAFAADKVYVAVGDDGTVRRYRPDGKLVREARVPVGSYNVSYRWRWLITPSLGAGTLAVLDRTGRVQAVRRIARAAHDACIVFGP